MLVPLCPKQWAVHRGGAGGRGRFAQPTTLGPRGDVRRPVRSSQQQWQSGVGMTRYGCLAGQSQGCGWSTKHRTALPNKNYLASMTEQPSHQEKKRKATKKEQPRQEVTTSHHLPRPPSSAGATYLGSLWRGYHVDCAGFDSIRLRPLIESKPAFPPASVSIR